MRLADDAVDIPLGIDIPGRPLGVEAGEDNEGHLLAGGGIVDVGILLRPAGVMVAQQRFKHLLAGVIGGRGGVPLAVFPVVAVDHGIAGKAGAAAELGRGLGPQHAVIALAAVQPPVQVVVILIGVLQYGVVDVGPGDPQPGLDVAVEGLVIGQVAHAGDSVIGRSPEIAAGLGGAERPAGRIGHAGVGGQPGGCAGRQIRRRCALFRGGSLGQCGFGLLCGLLHIGGQVGFGHRAVLPDGQRGILLPFCLPGLGRRQRRLQGLCRLCRLHGVDANAHRNAQRHHPGADQYSSAAVYFCPLCPALLSHLFDVFCHILLLFPGIFCGSWQVCQRMATV